MKRDLELTSKRVDVRPDLGDLAARVVVAIGSVKASGLIAEAFRRHGWEVYVAPVGVDPRPLAHAVRARASVLCASPQNRESGWLTCRKLLMDRPATKVVLVKPGATASERRLADFVGASALICGSMPEAAVDAVNGVGSALVSPSRWPGAYKAIQASRQPSNLV